jgi:hypothetical protein
VTSFVLITVTYILKAPHHSVTSWNGHWHSQHDLADKILAAARNELSSEESDDESTSSDASDHAKKKKTRRPDSDSDDDDSSGTESIEELGDTDEDEMQMGDFGSMLNEADIRVMARHVAAHPNWETLSTKDRWSEFGDLVRP